MNTYLTADLHLGHENIIEYSDRPFSGVGEMDEYLIQKIVETTKINDTLWILGDITGPPNPDDLREKLSRIPCVVRWIEGNHDPNPEAISDLVSHEGHYAEIKTGVKNDKGYELSIALSHYPMVRWNGSYHGHFHAHGHVHDGIKEQNLEERRIDVGVDAQGYKPVSVEELVETLSQVPAPKHRT